MARALGLFSGGLDSLLAAKLVLMQGVEVTGLVFTTPFFNEKKALRTCDAIGIDLIVKDISEVHFEILKSPKFGYGKNMNPCMDCHALMIKIAGDIMMQDGYDFIFTGEVLGQRPFSQNRKSLDRVARASGYQDYLLRPLSGRLFKSTIAEDKGIIDRGKLLDIQGRSRKRQFALAREWGIAQHAKTGGGCILTEPGFSLRLKEAFRDNPELTHADIEILKIARHFRISDRTRLIGGKDQDDKEKLEELAEDSLILAKIPVIPGPTAVLTEIPTDEELTIAARIVARYADTEHEKTYNVEFWNSDRTYEKVIAVSPFTKEESDIYLLETAVKRRKSNE